MLIVVRYLLMSFAKHVRTNEKQVAILSLNGGKVVMVKNTSHPSILPPHFMDL